MCIQFRPYSVQLLKMRFEVLVTEMRGCQAQGQNFQGSTKIINFVDILRGECACPETAAWISTHQPFLNEAFECLAHGRATYSQLFSQGHIRKTLLLASTHHDDALPDLFVSIIHNRGHCRALLSPEQIK